MKTTRHIENRLKSKNKKYTEEELIKQIVKNTNVDNFDTLLMKYSRIQFLLKTKKLKPIPSFKKLFTKTKPRKN
tara:strand:+ start:674 stop:895 length:222 start_codon:yes stop_codon:yes gene_type:complete